MDRGAWWGPWGQKESDTAEQLTLIIAFIRVFFDNLHKGFPRGASGKEPACQCRKHKRFGFNPWEGRSRGERNGNPLWYSCLENPTDREA